MAIHRNKRANTPLLSSSGQQALDPFGQQLCEVEDLRPATARNYLSHVRHFVAWCEGRWSDELQEEIQGKAVQDGALPVAFPPAAITTPTLTAYRAYLQTTLGLRPASINRALISLKRYFA